VLASKEKNKRKRRKKNLHLTANKKKCIKGKKRRVRNIGKSNGLPPKKKKKKKKQERGIVIQKKGK